MNIYLDKLAHLQVVINCRYSVAHMCTREDGLAYILGAPSIDDVMSYNSLTTILNYHFTNKILLGSPNLTSKTHYGPESKLYTCPILARWILQNL